VKIVFTKTSALWLSIVCTAGIAALVFQPARAQGLLDGYWQVTWDEDFFEYGPGEQEGIYGGLPVTPAAITAAHTWSPELITLPALQCEQLSATYGLRSERPMRIWEERDPLTQQQTQVEIWVQWQSEHRHIWLDGRPHPPSWAQKSWQGFSTGKWVGNVLYVHTDMMKPYYVARNGVPLDSRTTMDERFVRYGNVLTDIIMISDPQYLTRPVIESASLLRIPQGTIQPYPCRPSEEVPRAEGIVPMHLPGEGAQRNYLSVGPVSNGVPLEAAQGGATTMFPEYQTYMKTLPPNPPYSQIDKAAQKVIDARTRQ
jgi:hypothetical protein